MAAGVFALFRHGGSGRSEHDAAYGARQRMLSVHRIAHVGMPHRSRSVARCIGQSVAVCVQDRKSMPSLKLVAETPPRQLAVT